MATYIVKENQLLNDIALEWYGDHDRGMVDIINRNPHITTPTQNVFEGDEIEVGIPFNREIAEQLQLQGVATRTSENIYRGIGYDLISECATEEEDLIDQDARLCPRNAIIVG